MNRIPCRVIDNLSLPEKSGAFGHCVPWREPRNEFSRSIVVQGRGCSDADLKPDRQSWPIFATSARHFGPHSA